MDRSSYSDAALSRTLGTDDPRAIAGLRESLADPEAVYTLTYADRADDAEYSNDPPLFITVSADEIDRICEKYGVGTSHGDRRAGRCDALTANRGHFRQQSQG